MDVASQVRDTDVSRRLDALFEEVAAPALNAESPVPWPASGCSRPLTPVSDARCLCQAAGSAGCKLGCVCCWVSPAGRDEGHQ